MAAAEVRAEEGKTRCGEGRTGGDWVPTVFTAGTRTTETSDADMGVLRPRTTGPTRNGSHQSWTYSAKHEVKKEFTIGRSW